jgi:hypothetical protein
VEWARAFTKMFFSALDIIGHDICDGCARVALVLAQTLRRAVFGDSFIPLMAS